MTIVCVDDHPIMLRGLYQNIKNLFPNAKVNTFESSDEAYDFVKANSCDVLISEIELRGDNGITLANKISPTVFQKNEQPSNPVFVYVREITAVNKM